MAETDLPSLSTRGDDGSETPGAPTPDAPSGGSLNYEALRFPGCQPISLSREEFEGFDDRIEYWDARTGTAWVVADKYGVHEGTSRRLPHLAERIASVRGTPIVSYGSVTLLVRDGEGRPMRAMEADETLYLHPTRAALGERKLAEGVAQGRAEGVAQGRTEGRAQELAATVRSLLRARGWQVSDAFMKRAAALVDLPRDTVTAAALAAADEADFWRRLGTP